MNRIAEPVNLRAVYAIPANAVPGRPFALHLYSSALKSARAIRYARIPRIRRRLTGTGPGEVAVGLGCPVASAAEMKELIYLPESYNSLSTCIHTLSLVFLAGPPPPVPRPRLGRLPHSALSLFSPPPFLLVLSSPSLSTLSKFLALSSSLGDEARRLLPLCTFRALFAWLYMRIISERPCLRRV